MAFTARLALLAALSCLAVGVDAQFGNWRAGRATFYGVGLQRAGCQCTRKAKIDRCYLPATSDTAEKKPQGSCPSSIVIASSTSRYYPVSTWVARSTGLTWESSALQTDAWSIHKGSCMFGYLDYRRATGWDVAAISDAAHDYSGSCGKCKEVKCKNMNFNDGYGQWLDRSKVCWDESASVVVMVTDTCPCNYPNNYHSNKRWCCGDMYHLDLSIWAYEKLADTKWGVIGTSWRNVPCWHRPKKWAKVPSWKKKTPGQKPPPGFKRFMDGRPKAWYDFGK